MQQLDKMIANHLRKKSNKMYDSCDFIMLPRDQTTCVFSCKSLDLLISWWIYARPNPVTTKTRFPWNSCLATYLFVFFAPSGSENQHLHCCLPPGTVTYDSSCCWSFLRIFRGAKKGDQQNANMNYIYIENIVWQVCCEAVGIKTKIWLVRISVSLNV